MLSRTADNLFWLSRYFERAENTARLLDVAYRMSLLPSSAEQQLAQWRPILTVGNALAEFERRHGETTAEAVVAFMALDPANPSSIYASIAAARENARAERSAISTEMWESLNATWLDLESRKLADLGRERPREFFEWVKERSHLFRGVTFGTMYRDDAFHFIRVGTFLERADNTARILDVRYPLLLPATEGGHIDYFQWGALLRSVSAFRAYRVAYKDTIRPDKVAELLILDADMPRSLHHCLEALAATLDQIAPGRKFECIRACGELYGSLKYGRIDKILNRGLDVYLAEFLGRLAEIGVRIQSDFLMSLEAA